VKCYIDNFVRLQCCIRNVNTEPHKVLQLYISATSNVVSTTIVVERGESDNNSKFQHPTYFISEVLSDSKIQFFHIMKLAYALLITSHKLSHYFRNSKLKLTLRPHSMRY
jgi:hypothetical protein